PSDPLALDFSPDGHRAYVAAAGSNTVYAIDCATRQVVGRARTGRKPWIARVSPDGKLVLVSNHEDNTVSIFDANNLAVRGIIKVAQQPEQITVLPDSSKRLSLLDPHKKFPRST